MKIKKPAKEPAFLLDKTDDFWCDYCIRKSKYYILGLMILKK